MTRHLAKKDGGGPFVISVLNAGIIRHPAHERLERLLRDRSQLLTQVARAKRGFAKFSARVDREGAAVRARVLPLIAQYRAVAAEIRRLFDEILADARLSAGARKKVTSVFRTIEEKMHLGGEGEPPALPHRGAEVPSADARGADIEQSSLRGVFKRVALALHPDRGSSDDDRQRRTERMKEVTRAYDEGDLAKLLDLEETWAESAPPACPESEDEHERRCREIEVLNRALRGQIASITREHRVAKRKYALGPLAMPIDDVVAMAEADLARLVVVRDFIQSFRDRKITLKQLVLGPPTGEMTRVRAGDASR